MDQNPCRACHSQTRHLPRPPTAPGGPVAPPTPHPRPTRPVPSPAGTVARPVRDSPGRWPRAEAKLVPAESRDEPRRAVVAGVIRQSSLSRRIHAMGRGGQGTRFVNPAWSPQPLHPRLSDRRTAGCTSAASGNRAIRHYAEALATARTAGWVRVARPQGAPDARSSPASPRCSSCTSCRWRTRQAPTSDPRSSGIGDMTFVALRTTRYVEHAELTEHQRGRRDRRGDDLHRRALRHHRPPRGGLPLAASGRPGGTARAAAPGPVGGRVRGLRPVVDTYLDVATAVEARRGRDRGSVFARARQRPDPAHLPAQAGADGVQAGGRPAAAAAGRRSWRRSPM